MEHDNAYKLLFSEPQIVTDLLQGFVHEPWVASLDFSTLEKMPVNYVSEDLRDREDDVIWRVKCDDEWLYIYLLIEFQSTVDYFMAVRIMTYIGLLYQDLIKQLKLGKNDKLPPVFPVVLYNGERRWSAATQLSQLIGDLPNHFKKYKPSLNYLILDEGRYQADELNPLKNLVAAIFRLENAKTHTEMIAVIDDLIKWLTAPEQQRINRIFNVWIKRVLRASGKITNPIHNLTDLTEVKTMLAETIANWPKEWEAKGIEKGMEKGIEKGMEKGMEKGKYEMLIQEKTMFSRMISKRFDEAVAKSAFSLLENIKNNEHLTQIGEWIIECKTGQELINCIHTLLSQQSNNK